MNMKRVRQLLPRLDNLASEMSHNGDHIYSVAVDRILNELKAAIAPDWHPASKPPDNSRYVWVRTVSGKTTMATYNGAAGVWVHWLTGAVMGVDGVNEVVEWHEIEVPEPPEVGT